MTMLTDEQKKAMDCTKSHCVTAGAGAGKTHTLVERYVHLITNGAKVSEILAMTFTEKAAAEMKQDRKSVV
jgi:ATP-dependent exoDNAse (exonuclease V) beta subunit